MIKPQYGISAEIADPFVRGVLTVPHHDGDPLQPGQGTSADYAALAALYALARE